jgi:hypothetical protein
MKSAIPMFLGNGAGGQINIKNPQLGWSIFQLVTETRTVGEYTTVVLPAHFVDQY